MTPHWSGPWRSLDFADEAEALASQLQRELVAGHPLSGLSASPVARRDDTNDVLFELTDGRVAVVHLTWVNGPFTETYPWAELFSSMDAFLAEAIEQFDSQNEGRPFLDPSPPANRLPLEALSNSKSARFALPTNIQATSNSDEGPAAERRHHIWHELGSRLQADGRCMIYNHPALVSASGIIIATGFNSGYAIRVPQDVLDWAIEAVVRVLGEQAREHQAVAQTRLGNDWLLGAYQDNEIGWCRQMYKAVF